MTSKKSSILARQVAINAIEPASLVDKVVDEIRSAVLSGSLRPGEAFSISDLSADLGVSHIPVREALQRLEVYGLVELRRGKSGMIAPVTTADLNEIYEMRVALECEIVAHATNGYTPAEVEVLGSKLANMEGQGDVLGDEFWAAHYAFHRALLSPAIGPWGVRLLDPLWHAAERYHRLFLTRRQDVGEAMADHRALYDEACRPKPSDLKRLLKDHLDRNRGELLAGVRHLQEVSDHRGVTNESSAASS